MTRCVRSLISFLLLPYLVFSLVTVWLRWLLYTLDVKQEFLNQCFIEMKFAVETLGI